MDQQVQVMRRDLLRALISQQINTIEIKEVTLPKGQVVPKHFHPCPVVGYIKSGTVIFQIEGEPQVLLHEGDAFYEPKDETILHFDNASNEEPLVFVAFYLKEGDEELISLLSE